MSKAKNNKKILFITEIYPTGLNGTSLKSRNTIVALSKLGYVVDVICSVYDGLEVKELQDSRVKIFSVNRSEIKSKFIARRERLLKIAKRLLPTPDHILNTYDYRVAQGISFLSQTDEYPAVIFDGYSTLQYFHDLAKQGKVVYIDDEDFTVLYKKRLTQFSSISGTISVFMNYAKSLVYERWYFSKVDEIWAISEDTLTRFKTITNTGSFLMPTLITLQKKAFVKKSRDIVFTATYDWEENIKGLLWFLENHWLEILRQNKKVVLHLVGPGATQEFISRVKKYPNVKFHGFVDDLRTIYKRSALAIAPLLVNAGIKVKVLTSLSYALPTVSTKEGVGGLESSDGVIVTEKEKFATAVNELLESSSLRVNTSRQAHKNISKNYSFTKLRKFLSIRLKNI